MPVSSHTDWSLLIVEKESRNVVFDLAFEKATMYPVGQLTGTWRILLFNS